MKMKIAGGVLLLTASGVGLAQVNGTEWPVAAASLMVAALAQQDARVMALVVAPDAIYFPGYDEHASGRSTPFSLNSLAEIRNRCELGSVDACSSTRAQVTWKCAQRENGERDPIFTRVTLTNGKVSSVLGDGPPQICRIMRSP
jgi:hypothetical protein